MRTDVILYIRNDVSALFISSSIPYQLEANLLNTGMIALGVQLKMIVEFDILLLIRGQDLMQLQYRLF